MNIKKLSLLLLTIFSITASSCDSGDIYTYAKDTMLGPRFTSFSIDSVSGSIDTRDATVQLNLTENSNLSALTPVFTISGKRVEHNGTVIASGNAAIDFTNSQVFTIFDESGYSRKFTVSVAAPVSIAITPENPALALNQTVQLTATAAYTDGKTRNVTAETQWTSSDNTTASVSAGAVTGISEGTAVIGVQYGTLSGSVSITVVLTLSDPVSITITPENPSLTAGDNIQLTATLTYEDNTAVDITSIAQWTSSDNSLASVSAGNVTAITEGTPTITAQYDTFSDSVTVTVYPLPALTISPTVSTVESGETTILTFSCTYTESGSSNDVTDLITLASIDTDIVRINNVSSGTAEVLGWTTTGTGTIQASYAGVTADVSIDVTARSEFYVAPAAGGLDTNPGSIDYPLATISMAMGKAVNGDTVHVMAGTYNETVNLADGVSLYGSYPDTNFIDTSRDVAATPSIITAPADSYALYGAGTIGTDTTIGYFNINGPSTTSTNNIAIYLENDASPTIMQCNIEAGTSASSYSSYAIIIDSSSPVIHRNFSIRGGTGDIVSCAISITGTSNAVIRNNLIFAGFGNNSARSFLLVDCGSILIYNNTITGGCSSGNTFHGIFLMGYSYPDIKNNIILNRTGDGTGTFYGVYENSNDADPTDFSYNIVYNIYTDTGETCYADDLASSLYVDETGLNNITLYGGGTPTPFSNIVGNPALDGNYSLQGFSPYINDGIYLPVSGLADEDLYGNDRGTSGWDRGAIKLVLP